MSHAHWDGGPTCRFRTKAECNRNWTQFQHGHLGVPCVRAIQESKTRRGQPNKRPSCTIEVHPEHGRSFAQKLKEQLDAVSRRSSSQ